MKGAKETDETSASLVCAAGGLAPAGALRASHGRVVTAADERPNLATRVGRAKTDDGSGWLVG